MTDEEIIKRLELLEKAITRTVNLVDDHWEVVSFKAIAYDLFTLSKLTNNEIKAIKEALYNRSEIKEGTDGSINDCFYSFTKINES